MSRQVRKTPQAFAGLDAAAAYIALDNPQAALRFLDSLEARMDLLAGSPGMGRLRADLGAGLRAFPVESTLIIYRQTENGIEVVRVLHAARDIETLFQDGR